MAIKDGTVKLGLPGVTEGEDIGCCSGKAPPEAKKVTVCCDKLGDEVGTPPEAAWSSTLPELHLATSINIVTIPFFFSPLVANGETITFQTEYPPPPGSNIPVRPYGPGCDNLYCSEKVLQFIKATNVRFHFYNHTLVTNAQHRYYGLERILLAGR